MKILEILKEQYNMLSKDIDGVWIDPEKIDEAIKELEAYITNYQGIKRRLDNTVTTIAVLQNANSSLIKILEKMNEEMIELTKENEDLKERSK